MGGRAEGWRGKGLAQARGVRWKDGGVDEEGSRAGAPVASHLAVESYGTAWQARWGWAGWHSLSGAVAATSPTGSRLS